jgi:putative transposase
VKGRDGHKHVTGRKRHVLVDTQGSLLEVYLTAANVSDLAPALSILTRAQARFPRLQVVHVDRAYRGRLAAEVANSTGIRLQVTSLSQFAPTGYHPDLDKQRWVVERTFAWFGRFRRLSKDYEFLTRSSQAVILAVMSCLLLARLARF